MKMPLLLLFLSLSLVSILNAQQPKTIRIDKLSPTSVSGNLSDGFRMSTLAWAWNSSVACFPKTEEEHFTGHHVLFTFDLPPYTEMTIQMIPDNPDHDMSLYAYEVGTVNTGNTVPHLTRCVRCEADHRWDRPRVGKVQDHKRTVKNILALRNPYQVVVGVAGASTLSEGSFTLIITPKSR